MADKTNYTKKGSNGKVYKYYRISTRLPNGKDKEFFGKNKKAAEAKKNEYLQGIKSGLTADYRAVSLSVLMRIWLFEVLHVSNRIKPATFDRYEGIYRNYVKDSPLSDMKIHEIKSLHLQRYYNEIYEKKHSSSIIYNLNKIMKAFFNYAVSEDYILKNPCMRIVIPGSSLNSSLNSSSGIALNNTKKEITPFTDDEIFKIQNALHGHSLEHIFKLDLGTGLRIGELLALSSEDINLESGEIIIRKNIKRVKDIKKDGTYRYITITQLPKTKNSIRVVPIPSALLPYLNEYIKSQKEKYLNNGLEFTDKSLLFTTGSCNTIDVKNLRRSWERALKRIEIPYRNLHNIRHTYATKLFEAGVPLKTLSALLGHSNISVTANIYIHIMPKEKTKAADTLNGLFTSSV